MKILLSIALVALVAFVGYVAYLGFTGTPASLPFASGTGSVATSTLDMINEMQSTDVVVGTGAEAVTGKKVTVHYVGTLMDGTKFDASKDHGQPFSFTLGTGQVIQGWDEGVVGMKVGGKRNLVIPGELAYGAAGTPDGTIPPNATLKFEIELLKVE
ncbi:MAG: FKBP-type peptidyl-prolyl cis-trans isomerase [bacterium]|nr:FKBP-type peptidyl-prolyl cis-trans isomerase [bacterium]